MNEAVLAIDLGASSGRGIVGQLENGRLTLDEIHRFANDPVQVGDHLYWDILRLYHEIKMAILIAKQKGYTIVSMAIDSWAVDFGFIGPSGELLGNPYHYRDHHTDGIMSEVFAKIPQEEIFSRTGIQFLQFNTIFQLYALKKAGSPLLGQADALLMIPDLLRYFLTGDKITEYTNATTTQMLNARTQAWDTELLHRLGLPSHLLIAPYQPGQMFGTLQQSVCKELNIEPFPVIGVGEHDTASAVAAVPADGESFAYISCGTWSLLGTELRQPVLTRQAMEWNFTNEGGVDGTYRLLKNIMGLWLIQECARTWKKEGRQRTFAELAELAAEAQPFGSLVDPDDASFLNPPDMPEAIRRYCAASGQPVPETEGEIVRCAMESLALKYRYTLEKAESLAGAAFNAVHMVGGGINNTALCQFTANATGKRVVAGPAEASAIGNLLMQYRTIGKLGSLQEARALIRESFPVTIYDPQEPEVWNEVYARFEKLLLNSR